MAGSDSGGDDLLLVTGASGFVGSAIAIAARAAGYRVRVLVRPSSPRINVQPGDEVVVGDMCDRASLVPALRGVRYLAHAAADYRLWAPSADDIVRTNLDGTRFVMEEALRAGVERIVYTSSVATLELRARCAGRREPSARGEQGHRRLQEEQGPRRTSCRGHGEAAPVAGRDRQPCGADRAARREADTDRAHHRRVRARPHAGICGYRPQPRACRRRRRRASGGAATR